MRSVEDILKQHAAYKAEAAFLDFRAGDLINFLPFETAKPFLIDTATADDWKEDDRSTEAVKATILGYMPFAWDKANNNRGLSAARSLHHMEAWLWMAEEDQLRERLFIDAEDYTHYGKPHLRAICEHFGWDWKQWDDGRWTNTEDGPGVSPDEVEAV